MIEEEKEERRERIEDRKKLRVEVKEVESVIEVIENIERKRKERVIEERRNEEIIGDVMKKLRMEGKNLIRRGKERKMEIVMDEGEEGKGKELEKDKEEIKKRMKIIEKKIEEEIGSIDEDSEGNLECRIRKEMEKIESVNIMNGNRREMI